MAELSFLRLNRMRVMWRGVPVYDQKFHAGVNIIRGENGSGKSTVSDFIFYVLGGEYEDWKDVAGQCEEVQAEIETPRGKLTLRRDVGKKTTPIKVYFGPMEKAESHSLDGWELFPIRRQERQESVSQILFRSMLIPEAQSEGASNITMHQLMRLLYSDQRTPAPRLFRFESFDTQNIREAVGDLVCGISGYEIYEINLRLRDLDNDFGDLSRQLSALINALPAEEKLNNPSVIQAHIKGLEDERVRVAGEIENVDDLVNQGEVSDFLKQRHAAHNRLNRDKKKISELEFLVNRNELELSELAEFLNYLGDLLEKVGLAERAYRAIGGIEFTHCPACLADLPAATDPHTCNVCGSPTDPDEDKARYNQIRLDLEIQTRESKQLVDEKTVSLNRSKAELRRLNKTYAQELSEFSVNYDVSTSPREAFLAARNQRLGQIDREIEYFVKALDIAEEIQRLSTRKSELQEEIQKLKDRREALTAHAGKRRKKSLTEISDIAASLLKRDLERQAEFRAAQQVELNFRDDAIFVDGKMNFAESSNVFLKNAAIFGMFLAAGRDAEFFHPRFILLDNIEDKGMEVARSHLFQKLIVETATEIDVPYQVIFTTSMMNPELELDDYVIGPHYTHDRRTLEFSKGKADPIPSFKNLIPTPTDNASLPKRLADFLTLPDALDYAAQGQTGFNFYTSRGDLKQVLPFARLSAEAKQAARHLIGGGAKPGDRVALLAETAPDFLIAFFACQYAGVIPVPMPTPVAFGRREAYAGQIRNQITSSGAVMVITPAAYQQFVDDAVDGLEMKLVGTVNDLLALPVSDALAPGGPKDLCYLQYSSGSTRFSKGVAVSHESLMVNCAAMNVAIDNAPGERAVSWLPFYYDMGLVGFMLGCLSAQTTVDYLPTEDFARRPLTWLRIISDNRGTMSYGPSFGYELCSRRFATATAPDLDLSSWRVAGIGGEMIRPQVMDAFADVFGPSGFANTAFNAYYGLAECVLGVSFSSPGTGMKLDHISKAELGNNHRAVPVPDDGSGNGRTFVACGKVIQGHTVEIRDDENQTLAGRQVGRVFVSGPSVMQGYFGDPEATAACLQEGWLDTGDLGYFLDEELVIVGRSADMMIDNGRTYWPQDIEWIVEHIEGMRSGDAVAFCLEQDGADDKPTILVQCRPSDPELRKALADNVRTRVEDQVGLLCDVILVPASTLPKAFSGKLARGKAKANFLSGEIQPLAIDD